MKRKIIVIDEEKCIGCGLCASACHEGAIGMVNGKAKLLREDYCDGLGDCLPVCPTGAITFEEREAPAYDEAAVKREKKKQEKSEQGCPGKRIVTMKSRAHTARQNEKADAPISRLSQWPVQIRLVPTNAPYLKGANLLIAADCCAYAFGNFHAQFMEDRITLIGCPKLDDVEYADKLTEILTENEVKSITVVKMEVPCCTGMERAAESARMRSKRRIPLQVVTIGIDGEIKNNKTV